MYYTITKKNIIISLAIISIIVISSITTIVFSSSNVSWGLCFDEKNECPRGNATKEDLLEYDAYYVGDTTSKKIYLTFDAGYEAGYTDSILDTLKKHDVKACFFLVGNYFTSDAKIVQRMDDEGHIIGNHTETHPNMSKMSTIEEFTKQIKPVEEKYKSITGKDLMKFYRPPQGIFSTKNLEYAKSLGYKTIFWSVAYVDWERDNQPTHEKAMSTLLSRVHNGAIILLHSTSKTNMEILDEFITEVKNQGYVFDTLDNLGV